MLRLIFKFNVMDKYSTATIISKSVMTFGLLACFFKSGVLFGQVTLQGQVMDSKNIPIPFVRLGVASTRSQSIADKNGSFSIELRDDLTKERLTFQTIGYKTDSYSIDSLLGLQSIKILMEEQITQLPEFVFTRKQGRIKTKMVGNRGLVSGEFSRSFTAQYAVLIEPDQENSTLKSIFINIQNTETLSFKLRPIVYSANPEITLPNKNLVPANANYEFSLKKGWVELDVSNFQIPLDRPVFVGVEWVEISDKVNGKASIGLTSSKKYTSILSTRFGLWENYSGLGSFAIKVEVGY
uniref:carboxypeptidase-like regulatory domain-containing protein n=2 Tax=Roseivirga sp. TaxID=1964215 RepID=UPI0040477294